MSHYPYQLVLNHITAGEYTGPGRKDFKDYKQIARLCLNHKGKYLFEDEILSEYSKGVTLEDIFSQNKDRFVPGGNLERKGKRERTWYDIWSMEIIERKDDFFDYFFTCKLRQLDLYNIEDFLDLHLSESFEGDKSIFTKFLNLTIRKYESILIDSKTIDTVKEWITANPVSTGLSGEQNYKIKGRSLREKGDKKTVLSQEQTALLIEFLEKTNIILKMKGGDLNTTQAGNAFSILTGYSPDKLRHRLGKAGGMEFKGTRWEDYDELYNNISLLLETIDKERQKKRVQPKS